MGGGGNPISTVANTVANGANRVGAAANNVTGALGPAGNVLLPGVAATGAVANTAGHAAGVAANHPGALTGALVAPFSGVSTLAGHVLDRNNEAGGGAKSPSDMAREQQSNQEKTEAGLVQMAREKYDPGNAQTLEQQQRLKGSTVAAGRQQADDQLAAGLTNHRIQMARAGGLGGVGDEGGRGNLLAQYYGQLANAENLGRSAVSDAQLARMQQLGATEDLIHGQKITDAAGLYRDQAALANAATNRTLLNQFVGSQAPTLAQLYGSYAQSQAYRGG